MTTSADASTRDDRASRRRAQKVEHVLSIAEQAFAGTAYQEVRIEDLAAAADVSVGSIYGYFGSKNGLYLTLAERAAVQFSDYLNEAFAQPGTPLDQVMAAGEFYLRFHLEHPGSFQFLIEGASMSGPSELADQLRDRIGHQVEAILATFQARIQAAIDAGEIRADLDAHLACRFLWGAWNGVVSLGLRGDRLRMSDDEIAACIQQGRQIVRGGLAVRQPGGQPR